MPSDLYVDLKALFLPANVCADGNSAFCCLFVCLFVCFPELFLLTMVGTERLLKGVGAGEMSVFHLHFLEVAECVECQFDAILKFDLESFEFAFDLGDLDAVEVLFDVVAD